MVAIEIEGRIDRTALAVTTSHRRDLRRSARLTSPFAGRNAVQLMAAHLYEMPASPSTYVENIPEELSALLMRALAKNPAQRFENARAMASALSLVVATA